MNILEDNEFKVNIRRRPWVNGDAFIGPSLYDLVLAYFITQGEGEGRAKEFASAYFEALKSGK